MMKLLTLVFLVCLSSTSARAEEQSKPAPKPCMQIAQACKKAGFIKGDWKKGDGLWLDCVDPIMQGKSEVPGATKPLPTVDAALITACKAKHPKFGAGKVGAEPAKAK